MKLSNNISHSIFSPFTFSLPVISTADASLNTILEISLEKQPLNLKYLKLEQSKTLRS